MGLNHAEARIGTDHINRSREQTEANDPFVDIITINICMHCITNVIYVFVNSLIEKYPMLSGSVVTISLWYYYFKTIMRMNLKEIKYIIAFTCYHF